jgi:hypothetical protein
MKTRHTITVISVTLSILPFGVFSGCTQEQPKATALPPWYPETNEAGDPNFAVFEVLNRTR